MRQIIVIIIVVLIVSFAGALYGTRIPTDEKEEALTTEEVYAGQFPVPVPEITIAPMTSVPLY